MTGAPRSRVVDLWRHRSTVRVLVQRDLTIKYQQSAMGYLWSLVEPMAMAAIYWFVFGVLIGDRVAPEGGREMYPLFLVSGLFAWLWINSTITEATRALTSQAQMIKTVRVPREVYPIGRVVARFAEYLAAFPVLILFVVVFGGDVGWHTFSLLPALLLQAALLFGFALLVAPLNVMMRDIERMTRLLHRVLFYSSPILYPLGLVEDSGLPGWVVRLYELSPLVGIFQLHHAAWFPSEFPSAAMLATTSVGCVGMLLLGWWSFRRLEPTVLKEL
ncbi:MAG: ABC transporter permease [Micromonosporaceae bacterium]|nr:ABC transporter permease [Micromonosporaceae bacterium]